MNIDLEWNNFIQKQTVTTSSSSNSCATKSMDPTGDLVATRKQIDTPICDPISISTKTKIIYFNVGIDLFHRFWDFPMIDYDFHGEGIIKKQIKFNFTTKEEVANFNEFVAKEPRLKEINTLNQIDNPNGRIKFKDIKKIDIGVCKNDLIKQKKKSKSAFYNCFVLIYRAFIKNKYK